MSSIHNINNESPSLFYDAAQYFRQKHAFKTESDALQQLINQVELNLKTAGKAEIDTLQQEFKQLQNKLKELDDLKESRRQARLTHALETCYKLLALTEGANAQDTAIKTARFLGTVLLLSPGEGKYLAELHKCFKPAYKAVLSLRLLDELINQNVIKNTYILSEYDENIRFKESDFSVVGYKQSVILPILLSAIFQDVGLQHPELSKLLKGDGTLDEFRLLADEERKKMLALNRQYTLEYLTEGLGLQSYRGNNKQEQQAFIQVEEKRQQFQISLIKGATSSTMGIAEIVKVPQIYTSIVLSTKRDYSRQDLAKAAVLIEQLAVKKAISAQSAEAFVKIVGYFPQGYGVTYIAKDLRGNDMDNYEFAIVTQLYPKHKLEPICRSVSRNQVYMTAGKTFIVPRSNNLHFPAARKKLERVDEKRLTEILAKLSHNFNSTQVSDLVPVLWEPFDYFSMEGNQNIWGR